MQNSRSKLSAQLRPASPRLAPSDSEGAATVVAATGEIDASNIDRVTDYTWRAVAEGRGLVLDLGKLNFLGAQVIPVLISLSEECGRCGLRGGH
jgi:anti-anti-sigma factor